MRVYFFGGELKGSFQFGCLLSLFSVCAGHYPLRGGGVQVFALYMLPGRWANWQWSWVMAMTFREVELAPIALGSDNSSACAFPLGRGQCLVLNCRALLSSSDPCSDWGLRWCLFTAPLVLEAKPTSGIQKGCSSFHPTLVGIPSHHENPGVCRERCSNGGPDPLKLKALMT